MNQQNPLKNIKFPRPSVLQIILWMIFLGIAVGGFFLIRNLTMCWTLTSLPGMAPSNCGTISPGPLTAPVIDEQGTPVATAELPPPPVTTSQDLLPPAWDGASRINILFIGLDYRDWEANEGPPRSDTMILFTIDPATKTGGMLSIPRDMWVNIPGFGYSRINTAYSSGEGNKLPGGGPGLAMRTVEQFIGVPVQYYAQVDFNTFIEFVDMIGGIDIYSDEELVLDPLGTGMDHVKITCCGMRHLSGRRALAYARTRKSQGGDVDRAKRQQKVVFAIRNKVLSPEYFPRLVAQAPEIYNRFSAGIHTNMPLDVAIKLAVLGKDIPIESIKTGVIDYTMITLDSTILGGQNASVFKPIPDKIRILRDEIFTSTGPLSPLAQGDPTSLMRADRARVRIVNGSVTPGLAEATGNYLLAQGLAVTEVGNADRGYDRTVIILNSAKLYTLRYLATVFGVNSSAQVLIRPDPASTVDVEVRLGNDWANSNPIP